MFDGYRVFYGQQSDRSAARQFLEERLAGRESVVFVAEEAGRAVGFTQLYPSFTSVTLGPIYVLNDLFVDAGARRKGVGALLLAAARAYGLEQGAHYLELSTAVDNPAQTLYEDSGWIPDREYLHYELPIRPNPKSP
ncbi:MAG: GNAT family N-acetyltransferase [Thermoplasmata archaeon]|nr:GNAT family N-acetyltransferase [Thermoplasmata archaeon]